MSQVRSENAMVENCSIVKIRAKFAICLDFRLAKNSFQGSGCYQLNKNTFELWFQKLSEIFELEEDLDRHLVPPFIYKPTHKNHPSVIWARETGKNYEFTLNLLEALLSEYTFRFKKTHTTAKSGCASSLWTFPKGLKTLLPEKTITLPPMCMPDKFKAPNATSFDDVVQAYRRYYRYAKQHDKNGKFIGHYTARRPPEWL